MIKLEQLIINYKIIEYINSIIDLFLLNPIAQTSGFIWMICIWIAFLKTDDLQTIKILFIANIFWWLHFALLGSTAWLSMVIIACLRLALSIKYKKNKKVFIFLIILTILVWFFVYDWIYSLLPILASLIWAYSFFFLSWVTLRIWCLALSITWLIYNIYLWSISWIINEIIVEMLHIFTIYKYVWHNGYKIEFLSKIKAIYHPYSHVDYWHYTIIKDKDKISTKYKIREKIKNLFQK